MAVWNYENAAHLLGRVGFGGTPDDIQKFLDKHATVESAVDEMLGGTLDMDLEFVDHSPRPDRRDFVAC